MKSRLFSFALLFALFSFEAGSQTTETLATGSFIVNMGVTPQTVGNGMKPYGLVYELLKTYRVEIKWVIAAGKVRDGIDFTYMGTQFKGGTFVIPKGFISTAVAARITYWQTQGVVGTYTQAPLTLTITNTLRSVPLWTIDPQYGTVAVGFFTSAGIPSSAYNWITPSLLNGCNDIFVLPHADATWAVHGNLYNWNRNNKGAIWAGCHAVSVIEAMYNPAIPAQKCNFLSTTGLVNFANHGQGSTPFNDLFNQASYNGAPIAATADDPVFQRMGSEDAAHLSGSETIYIPLAGGAWRNTTKIGCYDATQSNVTAFPNGPASVTLYGRAFGIDTAGLVMYQGGHNIGGTGAANVAAMRQFFNFSFLAMLDKTPTYSSSSVPSTMGPGAAIPVSVSFVSPLGNTLTYQWSSSCGGHFANANAASTSFTPDTVALPTDCQITCLVSDPCGRVSYSSTATVFVPSPVRPVAIDDTLSVSLCSPVGTKNLLSNDYDLNNDALTAITIITPPSKGNVSIVSGGLISFVAFSGQAGRDSFYYKVCDPTALCDTGKVLVNIGLPSAKGCLANEYESFLSSGNAVAVVDSTSVLRGWKAIGAAVAATKDSVNSASINATGDILTLDFGASSNLTVGDSIVLRMALSSKRYNALMKIELSETNSFPSAYFKAINVAYSTSSFVYRDYGFTVPSGVTVRYLKIHLTSYTTSSSTSTAFNVYTDAVRYRKYGCVNAKPNANRDAITGSKNATLIFNEKTNDSDPQGFALSYSISRNPSFGTATVLSDGTLKYVPNGGYVGNDTIIYNACNTLCICDTGLVVIAVTATGCSDAEIQLHPAGNALSQATSGTVTNASSSIGIPNASNGSATGTAQMSGSSTLTLTLTDTVTSGETCTIRWAPHSAAIATITVQGSSNNSTWTTYSISPASTSSSQYTFIGSTFSPTAKTKYVKLTQTAGSPDIDAISYNEKCASIPNRDPFVYNDTSYTTTNVSTSKNLASNDVDLDAGQTLSVSLLASPNAPKHGAQSLVGNTITYTPTTGFSGWDTLRYKICDNGSPTLCDTGSYFIYVTPAPPLGVRDLLSLPSGEMSGLLPLSNDTKTVTGLVYAVVDLPDYWPASNGSVSLVADSVYYTPFPGFTGVDSFAYLIFDDELLPLADTAFISVTVTNQAPDAVRDLAIANQCQPATYYPLTNDLNPEGALNIFVSGVISPTPQGGTVTTDGSAVFYMPASTFVGSDSIKYYIQDLETPPKTDSAYIFIAVSALPNNKPEAISDTINLSMNSTMYWDLTSNDIEPDNQSLLVSLSSGILMPHKGVRSLLGNGILQYTAYLSVIGIDSFDYIINDVPLNAGGGCPVVASKGDTARVYIYINTINITIANNDNNSTLRNTVVSGNVLSNDQDPEGDGIVFSGFLDSLIGVYKNTGLFTVSGIDLNGNYVADAGTITISTNGAYSFAPTSTFTGVVNIAYQKCDNNVFVACEDAYLHINVIASNTGLANSVNPHDDQFLGYQNKSVSGNILLNDYDAQNNRILFQGIFDSTSSTFKSIGSWSVSGYDQNGTFIANAGNMSVYASGNFLFVPDSSFMGGINLPYRVCDNATPWACANATFRIDINPDVNGSQNDRPFATDDHSYTMTDMPLYGTTVLANDTDINGNALVLNTTAVSGPSHGTLVLSSNGTYKYTPSAGYFGPDEFVYQVCDNGSPSLCCEATVLLDVFAYNSVLPRNDNNNTFRDITVTGRVLSNDFDAEGDAIKFRGFIDYLTSSPLTSSATIGGYNASGTWIANAGSLSWNAISGDYSFTPASGFVGEAKVDYILCDSAAFSTCATANLSIHVILPFAPATHNSVLPNNDTYVTILNTEVQGNVLANDKDGEADVVKFKGFYDPSSNTLTRIGTFAVVPGIDQFGRSVAMAGSFSFDQNGSFRFTPTSDFSGTITIAYQACDTLETPQACENASITINVNPIDNSSTNKPPVPGDDLILINPNFTAIDSVLTNDVDLNGPYYSLTTQATLIVEPLHGAVSWLSNGKYTYVVNAGYVGPDYFVYEVCDSLGLCAHATVYLLISDSMQLLPVGLLNFNAIRQNKDGYIHWSTSSEINADRFDVYRSLDGINFSYIDTKKAMGNSMTLSKYHVFDKDITALNKRFIYYRLMMIDNDGQFEWSSIAVLKVDFDNQRANELVLFPNPTTGLVYLDLGKATILGKRFQITDIYGNIIQDYTITVSSTQNKVEFNTSLFASGMYFVNVLNEDGTITSLKFVKY